MIFYFTGTGNSRWVAEALGTAFDEPLVSIADALNEGKNAYPLGEREKVFFVFPVHSWGPAVLVPRFISRLILSGYKGQEVYFVCTCGDDCGYTDRIMRSILARRGIAVTGGFSVQMPNNYVLMPGKSAGTCRRDRRGDPAEEKSLFVLCGKCPSFEELYGLSVVHSLCDRRQPILCYGCLYLLRHLCEGLSDRYDFPVG